MAASSSWSGPRQPAPPRDVSGMDGVLLVDKPAGPTSHDIVDRIRRTFRLAKVGHGGTLDPAATGLLMILTGRGTKLSNYFLGSDKTYAGTLQLGVTTDSYDADGRVTREADWRGVTREQLEARFRALTGDQLQMPPMVSAVKINGVPLYKSARRGEEIERKPRLVHVYEFRLLDFQPPEAGFVVRCTKGTYVRALCHDVGEALGCGAHLKQLRRTQSGEFDVRDALPLDALLALSLAELQLRILPLNRFGRAVG